MSSLNNSNANELNRGIELMLKKRREVKDLETKQKTFGFYRTISLPKREIHINFNFFIVKKD
jgi:hypothetical protein